MGNITVLNYVNNIMSLYMVIVSYIDFNLFNFNLFHNTALNVKNRYTSVYKIYHKLT